MLASPSLLIALCQVRLVPRFGVEQVAIPSCSMHCVRCAWYIVCGADQGLKEDGSVKLRAVDHMSWSHGPSKRKRTKKAVKADSVNGHYTPTVKITHDHLDGLLAAMRMHKQLIGSAPWLWKADVDSAFRRLPIRESHKWAAGVSYIFENEPWVAFHQGMPFGATSSVVAWHRIGALITSIARELLHLPVYRYVDDWFAVDRYLCTCSSTACPGLLGSLQA
jgi:hypothetical protein